MLEQTRGYLKAKGVLFGLKDKRSIYENQYSKRLRFGIKTDTLNSIMIVSKYWFESNSLELSIRAKDDRRVIKAKKEDAQLKILRDFDDGESIYVRCILDPTDYTGTVTAQLLGIYSSKEVDFADQEDNAFEQSFVFDRIEDDTIIGMLIDYKENVIPFKNFTIKNDELPMFDGVEYGDLVKVCGSIKNEPIMENGYVVGKRFKLEINSILEIEKYKYTKEELEVKTDEILIVDDDLMPWEM